MSDDQARAVSDGQRATPPTPALPWPDLFYPCVWLAFLGFPLWQACHDEGGRRVLGLCLVVLFAACYGALFTRLVRTRWAAREPRALALLALLLAVGLVDAWWFGLGGNGMVVLPYLVAGALFTVQGRAGTWSGVALLVAALLAAALTGTLGASGWAIGAGVFSFTLNQMEVRMQVRTAAAEAAARRAVALAERNRVAGDVHDLLGHSLTVANLKLQLVERLVDEDAARARRELAETREIIAHALADVRSTVDLERGNGLDDELAGAAMALRGAGLDVQLFGDAGCVRGPVEFVLGRVVREATTNVLRHAHASRVEVRVEAGLLAISDDGDGLPAAHHEGNGLRMMRERVAEAGGMLAVGAGRLGGTDVVVTWPERRR